MNRVVKSFEKYRSRVQGKADIPDALNLEDIKVPVNGPTRILEARKMGDPKSSVSINFGAVQELAVYGPQERVETLYREVAATAKRLGTAKGRAFRGGTRHKGGRPNIHDIMRWLNALGTESSSTDLKFLGRLYSTLRSRSHDDIVAEVELTN